MDIIIQQLICHQYIHIVNTTLMQSMTQVINASLLSDYQLHSIF